MEICPGVSVVGFAGVGRGDGGVPWLLDCWRSFPSLLVFMYISFNLAN